MRPLYTYSKVACKHFTTHVLVHTAYHRGRLRDKLWPLTRVGTWRRVSLSPQHVEPRIPSEHLNHSVLAWHLVSSGTERLMVARQALDRLGMSWRRCLNKGVVLQAIFFAVSRSDAD